MTSEISISITDIIGQIDNGLALLLSLVIKEKQYDLIYWVDKNNNYRLEADINFLTDFKISNIYEYKNIDSLVVFIEKNIPNKNQLLNDYLI
jgi:D-Tyr-tRNAtyr deacylase